MNVSLNHSASYKHPNRFANRQTQACARTHTRNWNMHIFRLFACDNISKWSHYVDKYVWRQTTIRPVNRPQPMFSYISVFIVWAFMQTKVNGSPHRNRAWFHVYLDDRNLIGIFKYRWWLLLVCKYAYIHCLKAHTASGSSRNARRNDNASNPLQTEQMKCNRMNVRCYISMYVIIINFQNTLRLWNTFVGARMKMK